MIGSSAGTAWPAASGIVLLIVIAAVPLAPRTSSRVHSEHLDRPGSSFVVDTRHRAHTAMRRLIGRSRSVAVGPHDIAAWIDDLARSVRHGSTLRHTLESCVPTPPELAAITDSLRHGVTRGMSLSDALRNWSDRLEEHPPRLRHQLRSVGSVLFVASTAGGGASEPLDRLAASVRLAAADEMERTAQSAQAAMSARVLTLVPVAFLGLLLAVDHDVRDVVGSATGLLVVGAGIALNLLGARWMRHIINGAST